MSTLRHFVTLSLLLGATLFAAACGGDSGATPSSAPGGNKLRFETTKGSFLVELLPTAAPLGVERVRELVRAGFFTDAGIFRVASGFVIQFGLAANPKVTAQWKSKPLQDDPVKESNKRGYLTFATAGPNTRTTQLFFNLVDNQRLDGMGFAPVGRIVQGIEVIDEINAEYGERPNQGAIEAQGNEYLKANFPRLDYIKSVVFE